MKIRDTLYTLGLTFALGMGTHKLVDEIFEYEQENQRQELIDEGVVIIPKSMLKEYLNMNDCDNKRTIDLIIEMNTRPALTEEGNYIRRPLQNMQRRNPLTGDLERKLLVPNTFETNAHYMYFMREWLIPQRQEETERCGYPWRVYRWDRTA